MRKGGGKSKGSAFERECCVKLSLWVSDGKVEDVFWRSASSGGRSTVAAKSGKRLAAQAGDISCIHPIGVPFTDKFMVECKAYRDLKYVGLLTHRGHLVEFWQTAKAEAHKYGKMPLLIAKQNQQPATVCLTSGGKLFLLGGKMSSRILCPALDLRIVLFEDFLKFARMP